MSRRSVWERIAERAVTGAAEAMFPVNSLGAPDWREADVPRRMIEFFNELPAKSRRLMLLLFNVLELATPLLGPALRPFSRLSINRRNALIQRWRHSRVYLFRFVGDSVKMTLTMIYLSHPAVERHVGVYKTCEHPLDVHPIELRSGALEAHR